MRSIPGPVQRGPQLLADPTPEAKEADGGIECNPSPLSWPRISDAGFLDIDPGSVGVHRGALSWFLLRLGASLRLHWEWRPLWSGAVEHQLFGSGSAAASMMQIGLEQLFYPAGSSDVTLGWDHSGSPVPKSHMLPIVYPPPLSQNS